MPQQLRILVATEYQRWLSMLWIHCRIASQTLVLAFVVNFFVKFLLRCHASSLQFYLQQILKLKWFHFTKSCHIATHETHAWYNTLNRIYLSHMIDT
jgi:hypothetical protein